MEYLGHQIVQKHVHSRYLPGISAGGAGWHDRRAMHVIHGMAESCGSMFSIMKDNLPLLPLRWRSLFSWVD